MIAEPRGRAVVMTVALAVGGAGMAVVGSVDAAEEPPPGADAATIVAGLEDASPYAPLERLGRWDGTSYVGVGARSVDTDQVIVISHGWEPGYQERYAELQAASSSLVTVWDPALVDPELGSPLETIGPMAEALATAEPDATVMVFSWIDQSATPFDPFDARRGEDATEINGHRLAIALDQALSEGWDGELHLIGHSFGSSIVSTAALAVEAPLRQLTLMDSPDDELVRLGGAANDLRYKLPRLDIGRSPGSTFVDNYISEVGIRYGDLPGLELVVDTQLHPPDGGFTVRHQYPLVWYRETLEAGPGLAPTGPWWSPLLGGDPAAVGAYYAARDAASPLALTEVEGVPSADVAADLLWPAVPLELATGGSALTVGAPADLVAVDLPTTEDSLLLEFDVAFDGAAQDASLEVAVDGRLRYTAVGPAAGTGDPGSMVLLWDLQPGEHTLTVALTGGGDGATATLSGLRIVEVDGIVRNLDEQQTTELVEIVLVVAGAVAVAVLVGLVLLVRSLVRRRRHAA